MLKLDTAPSPYRRKSPMYSPSRFVTGNSLVEHSMSQWAHSCPYGVRLIPHRSHLRQRPFSMLVHKSVATTSCLRRTVASLLPVRVWHSTLVALAKDTLSISLLVRSKLKG